MTIANTHDTLAAIIGPCSRCKSTTIPVVDDPEEFIALFRSMEANNAPEFKYLKAFQGQMVCDRCSRQIEEWRRQRWESERKKAQEMREKYERDLADKGIVKKTKRATALNR